MKAIKAAQQILQHANAAGLSPKDWADKFNKFNSNLHTQRGTMTFEQEPKPGIAITMLSIPAGSFLMGSPEGESERFDDEGPQHEVTLGAFFMAQTPITQAQWRTVAAWQKLERDLKPDPAKFKGANLPVERVSWHDAQEFCRRLSQRTGQLYGLPSEAQWEYACRAGSSTPFYCGATLTPELANCNDSETVEVASHPANDWGLHDMHGNVWEWCADHWHDNYQEAPGDGGAWIDEEAKDDPLKSRLLRGGSWGSLPRYCRSAFRLYSRPGNRYDFVGFRVCCLPQD